MRSSSPLARTVLIGTAVLVLALVVVLYMALRPPRDESVAPAAVLTPRDGAAATGEELPVADAGEGEELPQAVETDVERLGPNAILGKVLDAATGQPVIAFSVDVIPWAESPPLERLAAAHDRPERAKPFKSGAGLFRLERAPGRWDVIVHAKGYLPGVLADVVVPRVDDRPAELRLDHGPSITGLVTDVDARPLPDVPVFLHVTRQFTDAKPPQATLAKTDGEGRFRFSPLPPGEYALSLLEQDNAIDRLAGLSLQNGTLDVTLPMQPRHQVVIWVKDETDQPLMDAEVELRGPASSTSGRTLASGQAVLDYLPDGQYEVSITRDQYETLTDRLQLDSGAGNSVHWFRLTRSPGN